jgi:hypothetical protein
VSRCEICDREIRSPRRAWLALHWPQREWSFSALADRAFDLKAYQIVTCGDEVCGFRARVHGVPGATYAAGAA